MGEIWGRYRRGHRELDEGAPLDHLAVGLLELALPQRREREHLLRVRVRARARARARARVRVRLRVRLPQGRGRDGLEQADEGERRGELE